MAVTCSSVSTAVAVAPLPPPPSIETDGVFVCPQPPSVIVAPTTNPFSVILLKHRRLGRIQTHPKVDQQHANDLLNIHLPFCDSRIRTPRIVALTPSDAGDIAGILFKGGHDGVVAA